MRVILLLSLAALLAACAPEPGTERWCAMMDEKSKSDWTLDEGKTYASRCVFESRTIGSEEWCEDLEKKDKEDWTTGEAADYAKHCVI